MFGNAWLATSLLAYYCFLAADAAAMPAPSLTSDAGPSERQRDRRQMQTGQTVTQCRLIISAIRGGGSEDVNDLEAAAFAAGNSLVQLSEVELYDEAFAAIQVSSTTNPGGSNPSSEGPEKASDGSSSSKWFDNLCCSSTLVLTLATPSTLGRYELKTANDRNTRDPTSWTLECVVQGATADSWSPIDAQIDFAATTARYTAYGLGPLAIGPGAPPPKPPPPFAPLPPLAPPPPPPPPSWPPLPATANEVHIAGRHVAISLNTNVNGIEPFRCVSVGDGQMNCSGNIIATDFQSATGPSLLSLHRELADVRRYVGMQPPAAPPPPQLPYTWSELQNTNCWPPDGGAALHDCCPQSVYTTQSDLSACEDHCDATPPCDGVTYSTSTDRCYLRYQMDLSACASAGAEWVSAARQVTPPSAPPVPPNSPCLRIVTGTAGNNDGTLDVYVDQGAGYAVVISGETYAKGSTVVDACYATFLGVQVTNPTTNAWTGSVEVSQGSGAYSPLDCTDCTATGSTASIVVDGNSDGASLASTQCMNGATCTLVRLPPAPPVPPHPPPMQPPPSSPPSPEYVGCFSQGFCATSSIGNTNSATACRDAAVQGGFSYFGLACPNTIWNGFHCFSCNNITLASPLADSQCTSSAGSGGSSCGCTGYPYGTYSQSGFYLGGCNNMALYRLP